MIRLLTYLLIFGTVLYFLSVWGKKNGSETEGAPLLTGGAKPAKSPKYKFKSKPSPNDIWVQVFETETLDEARRYQARIQEDDIACIIYEQGRKDIHGNDLSGVGVAVPKSSKGLAQNIISRMSL